MQKSQEGVTIRGVRQSHLYVVAYDIPNDQRRTNIHKVLKGFGKWTECAFTPDACLPKIETVGIPEAKEDTSYLI